MNKDDESPGWFGRLRQFLHVEPQNRDELIHLLRDVQERALIDEDTLRMLEGVIQFAQLQVRDIMVPKNQMVAIDKDTDLQNVLAAVKNSGHSRFPVVGENCDEIIGILHAKDLFRFNLSENDQSFDLEDIVRTASIIPDSKRLDLLLSEFRTNRNHMAIVVDEYGAVSGFVTIEDIIEQIVGDIEDEFDIDEEDFIKKHDHKSYVLKGHTPIEEFNEQLGSTFSDEQYDTISGIVMNQFGYLPAKGESIVIDGWEFKIINSDARRIKLLACSDCRNQNKLDSTKDV